MPPFLLISSVASSAQAFCVGPNSDAGPLRAMKRPILNSLFAAAAGQIILGKATNAAPVAAVASRARRVVPCLSNAMCRLLVVRRTRIEVNLSPWARGVWAAAPPPRQRSREAHGRLTL